MTQPTISSTQDCYFILFYFVLLYLYGRFYSLSSMPMFLHTYRHSYLLVLCLHHVYRILQLNIKEYYYTEID